MGWFTDLISERKKKNQEVFEDSLKNISSSVFGREGFEEDPLSLSLYHILKHYNVPDPKIPRKFNDVAVELDSAISRYNFLTRPVTLTGNWWNENNEPILAFTKNDKTAIALFPKKRSSYWYYIHPKTGKKVTVTLQTLDKLEIKAITFYHPLPSKSLTLRDYQKHLSAHIKFWDVFVVMFIALVVIGIGIAMPYLTKILMGDVINNKDYGLFLGITMAMLGISVVSVGLKSVQVIANARLTIKVERAAHSSLMMRLLSLPASFFKKYSTGELSNRVNSVTNICNLMINGVILAGLSAVLSLGYLGSIVGLAGPLILPSIGIVLLNLAFTIAISFVNRRVAQKQALLYAEESGVSYDMIQGIQKIRLTGSEKRAFAKWAFFYGRAAHWEFNPPLIVKMAPVFSAIISAGGAVLLYYLVAYFKLDQSSYIAFTAAYAALSTALLSFSLVVTNVVRVRPQLEMIRPILETEPEQNEGKKEADSIEGDIKLDHVSFRYEENEPLVLDDLSLHIKKGEYVAIVGKTGCGKSTIVRLLLGFEKPKEGHVYYDDVDIEEYNPSSLRGKIGSVTQNGTLFHADIFHNIIISAPELTEEDAWRAAKIARIDDDIRKMPMGMNTIISEGSGGISGGQKQRLMIARAVVHNPKIVLLDEATSALDNRRQNDIIESIGKLDCTRIVIAHRLSTIRQCDRILYLEGGKIVEEGTFDELVELGGRFKELIERQKLE